MNAPLPLSVTNNRRLDKWVRFDPDRRVQLAVGKVEIGQGVLTALSQIAAEELDVGFDRISILAGDTEAAPDEGSTSSSQSIEMSGSSVRLIMAEVRARVLDRLARRLNCSPEDLRVEDGEFMRRPALITGISPAPRTSPTRRRGPQPRSHMPPTAWSARACREWTCRRS